MNGNEERKITRPVYNQCVWILKDYERLKKIAEFRYLNCDFEYDDLVFYADEKEGLISDNVMREASFKVYCIEKALSDIPEEYRKGILNNVINDEEFPDVACFNTWKKRKQEFMHNVAKYLYLI